VFDGGEKKAFLVCVSFLPLLIKKPVVSISEVLLFID